MSQRKRPQTQIRSCVRNSAQNELDCLNQLVHHQISEGVMFLAMLTARFDDFLFKIKFSFNCVVVVPLHKLLSLLRVHFKMVIPFKSHLKDILSAFTVAVFQGGGEDLLRQLWSLWFSNWGGIFHFLESIVILISRHKGLLLFVCEHGCWQYRWNFAENFF